MKKSIKLLCAAKINLSLDVTGKRPDHYHTLASIFQSVSVYDELELVMQDGQGISLACNMPGIPCDERNLAYKAAGAFLKASGIQADITINLKKHIPSGAGMGGGSADAAGVLYGLNLLSDSLYDNAQLREIGVKLGADVPFILLGGTALAEGIGEILTPLPALPELPLVILKGEQSISTPEAYRAIDVLVNPVHPDTEAMLQAVRTKNIKALCQHCSNLFEAAVQPDDVRNAKQALLAHGAACAVMTGSGAAVFGIFKDNQKAQACADALKAEFAFAHACYTTGKTFLLLKEG